jgi:hypothetical protein
MRQLANNLRSTIEESKSRLLRFTETDASRRRHEGKWSSKEILGHLIDSAANNHQRFVRLQFAEYLELPGYEQESWVRSQGYADRPWFEMVTLWTAYNLHLAHIVERLPDAALQNRCKIGSHEPMTLEFIATDYLRHLCHHLEQITAPLPPERPIP